jgi:UMF1 family MFS transporter
MSPLLERFGLHRPELRAWVLYDWANSVFMTTVVQVFPIYFAKVAAAGVPPAIATRRFALATTLSMLVIALLSPALGALADYAGIKKKMLAAFMGLGVLSTAGLYFVTKGDWVLGAALFVLGNIGLTGSFVFYDSLLPHIARQDEVDRVSTAGFALGYLGGGLLLAFNLWTIQDPARFGLADAGSATRLAFVSAAIWWLAFSIPLFLRVPEPPRRLEPDEKPGENPVQAAFLRLRETLGQLRRFREAFVFLVAFLIYSDGISTIIRMATIYGTEIGIAPGALMGAAVLVQFVGVPFSFLFGAVAGWIGAKRAIFIGLAAYVLITLVGYLMTTALHFFVLAGLVGMVMGGTQALSRSLFSTMIPKHQSSEFFAFFSVFDKLAGIIGPALFAAMISATGSSRPAILALAVLFVVGGVILCFVDVEKGQRAARQAESRRAAGCEGSDVKGRMLR